MTVGSATPRIKRGCPPKMEWMVPQIAVEARVSTMLNLPSTTKFKKCKIHSLYTRIPVTCPRVSKAMISTH